MKTKDLVLVIIQFVLLIIFIIFPAGQAMNIYYQLPAFLLTITGLLVFAAAILTLGQALTPMPTPKHSGTLIVTGIYKYIRHPIYSGIIMAVLGISIFSMNVPRFIMTLIIYIFFQYKSRYEETMLRIRYPHYTEYSKATGRFFPKVF